MVLARSFHWAFRSAFCCAVCCTFRLSFAFAASCSVDLLPSSNFSCPSVVPTVCTRIPLYIFEHWMPLELSLIVLRFHLLFPQMFIQVLVISVSVFVLDVAELLIRCFMLSPSLGFLAHGEHILLQHKIREINQTFSKWGISYNGRVRFGSHFRFSAHQFILLSLNYYLTIPLLFDCLVKCQDLYSYDKLKRKIKR